MPDCQILNRLDYDLRLRAFHHDRLDASVQQFIHRPHEAIAPLRYRLNKLPPVLAKGFSQDRDVVGEVGFLNYCVGPDHSHQLIFFQQTSVTLDQREQKVEDFGLQRDDGAVAHQQALGGVQLIEAEFVNLLWLMAHEHSKGISNSAPRNSLENP